MSLLHLLQDYYKTVEKCDRIYIDYLKAQSSNSTSSTSSSSLSTAPKIQNETLLLQKQVATLTSNLQALEQENDRLKESQRTIRALSESKLQNYKNIIQELKKSQSPVKNSGIPLKETTSKKKQKNSIPFHLLSPVGKRVIDSAKHKRTIFDDNESEETEDSFVSSLKSNKDMNKLSSKRKLNQVNIPKMEEFLKDEDNDTTSSATTTSNSSPKKRKLTKKRIQPLTDLDIQDKDNSI